MSVLIAIQLLCQVAVDASLLFIPALYCLLWQPSNLQSSCSLTVNEPEPETGPPSSPAHALIFTSSYGASRRFAWLGQSLWETLCSCANVISSTLFYPNPEKAAEWSSCGWDSYFCTIDVSVWVCPCVCVFVRKCQWCTCLSFYSQILDHTCWSWSLILWTIKALVLDIRLLEVFSLSSSFFSTWFCI